MDRQTGNSNSSKRQRNSQVVARWDYVQETSPAFKRLMALLLEDKEEKRSDEQRDRRKSPQ